MKRYLLLLTVFLSFANYWSQTTPPPNAFKYQAIVRDVAGEPQGGINVSFEITIKSGSCTGTPVYQEQFSVNTNSYGLVNLSIGEGSVISGVFDNISWGSLNHYIDVSMDIAGGIDFTPMTCTKLLSVPYALYAKESGSGPPGPQGAAGPSTLLETTVLAPGDTNCVAGGIFLQSFIDSNSNGVYDASFEVYDTIGYVCNGDPSTDNQQIDTLYIDNQNGDNYLNIKLENSQMESVLLDGHGIGIQVIDDFGIQIVPGDTLLYIQLLAMVPILYL